ncbi:MAG: NAD(P)/FAD-dependent oxidoreductase [Pseudomonadota bacterium]
MSIEQIDTLVIGGGQAGLAMSAHLRDQGVSHLVLERHRIAERWRSERWDSLVANGPAWHDRFPPLEFTAVDVTDEAFPTKERVVAYFEKFAKRIDAPIRCGVEVTSVVKRPGGGFRAETSDGVIDAQNVVAATGPFQVPVIPTVVPDVPGLTQMHSTGYRNPDQLTEGAVLVVGAGSSGAQIADELLRAGRQVYLSVGAHDRPPRRYRGQDYCWWLGVLGIWGMKTPPEGRDHIAISVSGAHGGHTVDFRELAARGLHLVGMTQDHSNGVLHFAPDLADNIRQGDADYLSVLDQADAYAMREGLDLPPDPEARKIGPDPDCMTNPTLDLNLAEAGISTIIWATGFKQDFSWLKVDAFENGQPAHHRGVSTEPGVYFLGLPWLSMRGSSFIWGVWVDAEYLAKQIAARQQSDVA